MDLLLSVVLRPLASKVGMASTSTFDPERATERNITETQEPPVAERGFLRTADFWKRVSFIFIGYKIAQGTAVFLRLRGDSQESIAADHWEPYYQRVGRDMHSLCVDMRGLLLKVRSCTGYHSDWCHCFRLRASVLLHGIFDAKTASRLRIAC
jgi:hypothetical protein